MTGGHAEKEMGPRQTFGLTWWGQSFTELSFFSANVGQHCLPLISNNEQLCAFSPDAPKA